MKIAYLISVYKDPTQFKRMVRILDNGHTHFFIHVDAKVGQEAFTPPPRKIFLHFANQDIIYNGEDSTK